MGGAFREAPLLAQLHDDRAEQQHRRAGQGRGQEHQPVLARFQHLSGPQVFAAAFGGGGGALRRVFQQGAGRRAHRQHQTSQHPKTAPNAPPPAQRAHQNGEHRPRKAHRPADDPGGQALLAGIPLLGAAHHRRIEEGAAQPHRQGKAQIKEPGPPRRDKARAGQARRQQRRARKARGPGARPVLQKAAQHTPQPEGADGEAEHEAGRSLVKTVLGPHRALKHAPGGGHAGEDLDGGSRRQDGPSMVFQKCLHGRSPFAVVFGLVWPHPVDKYGRGRL